MSTRPGPQLLALTVCIGFLAGAPDARADEPLAPTPDTNPAVLPDSPAQPNLILIGAVVAAGWYGGAVGLSYLWPDSPGAADLRIPVAGPYMALASTGCGDQELGCGTFLVVVRTVLTSLSAVGQTGGVLAMAEGLFLPTSSASKAAPSAARDSASVRVAPFVSGHGDGLGVGLNGSF
jgi:hypothetical protein